MLKRAGIAVFLFAAVGCGNGGKTFGGPYNIGGVAFDQKIADAKIAEFDAIKAKGWDSSLTTELDHTLFADSVKSNKSSGLLYADEYQRYNYVVKDDKIRVAVWSRSNITSDFRDICGASGSDVYAGAVTTGTMVNFFPEDTNLPSLLPFTPTTAPGVPKDCAVPPKPTGVLDAHSKHFMLAQGINTRLSNYTPSAGKTWAKTSVDYAGEIIVDLRGCRYLIDQGSGTYRPSPDDTTSLHNVAILFQNTLGSAPEFVWITDRASKMPPPRVEPTKGKEDMKLICP